MFINQIKIYSRTRDPIWAISQHIFKLTEFMKQWGMHLQCRRGKTRETIKYQQTITPIHLPPLGKNCELFTCYQFVLLLCNNWSLRLILDILLPLLQDKNQQELLWLFTKWERKLLVYETTYNSIGHTNNQHNNFTTLISIQLSTYVVESFNFVGKKHFWGTLLHDAFKHSKNVRIAKENTHNLELLYDG